MKLIYQGEKIVGAGTDEYSGPDAFLSVPDNFDLGSLAHYRVVGGELVHDIEGAIVEAAQGRLDGFARTRGYDGILSAATYATSTVEKFKTEGQLCVELRDATWAKLYEILDEVKAGTRPLPGSIADIESDLPELAWPEEPVVEVPAEEPVPEAPADGVTGTTDPAPIDPSATDGGVSTDSSGLVG